MILAALVIACAASESLPLAGILNDPERAQLVRQIETILERNPAILALHRRYLAERRETAVDTAPQANVDTAPQANVDAILYEIIAQRMATSRSLFAGDDDVPADLSALRSAGQLNAAQILANDPRMGGVYGGDAATARMLAAIAPNGRLETTADATGLPTLPPVQFDAARATPIPRAPSVEPELRRMVNAHAGLRDRYDTYVDILTQYPIIERAAENYWQQGDRPTRTTREDRAPARPTPSTQRPHSPAPQPAIQSPPRPVVPRPARPAPPTLR